MSRYIVCCIEQIESSSTIKISLRVKFEHRSSELNRVQVRETYKQFELSSNVYKTQFDYSISSPSFSFQNWVPKSVSVRGCLCGKAATLHFFFYFFKRWSKLKFIKSWKYGSHVHIQGYGSWDLVRSQMWPQQIQPVFDMVTLPEVNPSLPLSWNLNLCEKLESFNLCHSCNHCGWIKYKIWWKYHRLPTLI